MTLNTRIYVLGEVDPHETFHECRRLLGATEQHAYEDRESNWRDHRTIMNSPGQGLDAWLIVQYRAGEPLRTPEQATAHDDCLDDCDGSWHPPACWLEVSFDTAYSYSGPNGAGCGDLHAALVTALGRWLDERGVSWRWLNEFTGDVHDGYDGLGELGSGGDQAREWLFRSVLPAIFAGTGEPS